MADHPRHGGARSGPRGARRPVEAARPAVRESSAGGVVVRELDGQLEVALIRPRGRTLWALPKGHIDPGETAESAALREVCEETGLRTTLEASLGEIRYTYSFRGKRIDKDVQFFLFRWTEGPEAGCIDALEPAMRVEVDEARWVPLREATSRLAYEGERLMARRAVDLLDHRAPRALTHRAEDMLERQGVVTFGPVNLLARPTEATLAEEPLGEAPPAENAPSGD